MGYRIPLPRCLRSFESGALVESPSSEGAEPISIPERRKAGVGSACLQEVGIQEFPLYVFKGIHVYFFYRTYFFDFVYDFLHLFMLS